jgi:hypothetical protein
MDNWIVYVEEVKSIRDILSSDLLNSKGHKYVTCSCNAGVCTVGGRVGRSCCKSIQLAGLGSLKYTLLSMRQCMW